MTPWQRLRDRVAGLSEQDRRHLLLMGVSLLILVLLVLISPWALWPIATAAIWLLGIGLVVFVAVRLALRGR